MCVCVCVCVLTALYARRAEVVESRLEDMMRRMEALVDGPQDFPVKAAFVTFNLEVECRACMDNLPHGETRTHTHTRTHAQGDLHTLRQAHSSECAACISGIARLRDRRQRQPHLHVHVYVLSTWLRVRHASG